jgi:carboxylesterase type B
MTVTPRPAVTLAQGQVMGIQLKETFPQTIDAFLGVPYALPPVGERRFKPAEKTQASTETIDCSKYGPMAPGKALLAGGPKLEQSEDCLTANIFRPAGTTETDKLPVALYIHGGAFNRGAAAMHNTGSMVAWSELPFIGVSFGYRIGALGFLPSSLSKKEGLLNLGLRDQIHLFEWVQENIGKFGGDPGNITLFGLSAGAHSVCLSYPMPNLCKLTAIYRSAITFSTTKGEPHHCFIASFWSRDRPHPELFDPTMLMSTKSSFKTSSERSAAQKISPSPKSFHSCARFLVQLSRRHKQQCLTSTTHLSGGHFSQSLTRTSSTANLWMLGTLSSGIKFRS